MELHHSNELKIGYKLVTLRKDGSLGPLFIKKKQRFEVGKWMKAEAHLTKGFAFRPGFHILDVPVAPHLKNRKDRIWVQVTFLDYSVHQRPDNQGGKWYLANYMKILRVSGV